MEQESPVLKTRLSRTAMALLAVVLAPMVLGLFVYANQTLATIAYPFQMDYGEGIVWQQMRYIASGQGYGPIDRFPAIVFHYPPVYFLVSAAWANLTGMDGLASGRTISALSAISVALFIGLITYDLTKPESPKQGPRWPALGAAAVGGLMCFGLVPVSYWSAWMRVDVLVMAFTYAGLYLAMKALKRPNLIYVSAVFFVAAVFTKQTSVAAPAGVFLTLLIIRPALAMRGIATCIVLGLIVLGGMALVTDGNFLRHIFLYNVNRFDFARLQFAVIGLGRQIIYVAIGAFGVISLGWTLWVKYRSAQTLRAAGAAISANEQDASRLLLCAYYVFATPVVLMIIKSGSSYNYLIEFAFVTAAFCGLPFHRYVLAPLTAGLPIKSPLLPVALSLAIAFQAFQLSTAAQPPIQRPAAIVLQQEHLRKLITLADKPVISDDMVMILRGGKSVVWESAIFAELASTGIWDERPFVQRIKNKEFAFFATEGDRGDFLYDSRYTPAVAAAIESNYPVQRTLANLLLHFPSEETATAADLPR